jgi:transposase
MMESIVERCCGLDVHQATVVACVLVGSADQKPRKEIKTFQAVTKGLLALREWLLAQGCTHVCMESTGIYWKPVYAILEGSFDLTVGNAHHIKNVPGRKTDVKDAEWLAHLLRHGLIAKSFVPPPPIRDLRDLVRYRRKLVESRTAERNRLSKLLETANIKLSSVVSDVYGVSGMAMLHALLEGTTTATQMAQLAKKRMRSKIPELELALDGRIEEHHRFLLKMQLGRLEQVDADIKQIDERIDTLLDPYRDQQKRLMQIPGVDRIVAAIVIAEIGVDMSVFKSASHLAAWAGVCPGNNESAGKQKSSQTRKGNVHLKTALIEAAVAANRKKGSYFKDKFFRMKARRGYKRAAMAIAHKILKTAHRLLSTGDNYNDIGDAFLDHLDKNRVASNLVRRLERLGFHVQLTTRELPTAASTDTAEGIFS